VHVHSWLPAVEELIERADAVHSRLNAAGACDRDTVDDGGPLAAGWPLA
jgi:hypothetical protein